MFVGEKGNLPNEEFFLRRIETSPDVTTGLSLRHEEEEYGKTQHKTTRLNQGRIIESWKKLWCKYISFFKCSGYDIHDFYSLCRGERLAHSCSSKQAMCHLTSRGQPYFVLSPLKLEIVCHEPTLLGSQFRT